MRVGQRYPEQDMTGRRSTPTAAASGAPRSLFPRVPLPLVIGVVLAVALMAQACSRGDPVQRQALTLEGVSTTTTTAPTQALGRVELDRYENDRCDQLDRTSCLLPFPNDYFTSEDLLSPTGRRVNLALESMPANKQGVNIDPRRWNRLDGFAGSTPIMASFPGLDFEASALPGPATAARSIRPNAAIVIWDTVEERRIGYWVEQSESGPGGITTLIIRTTEVLAPGHRIVVGIRSLKGADGELLTAGRDFGAFRDRQPTTPFDPLFERRRADMNDVFDDLRAAGVRRDERLQLAWSFTVASDESMNAPLSSMILNAFATLGGDSPSFTIDQVVDGAPTEEQLSDTTVADATQTNEEGDPIAGAEADPEATEAIDGEGEGEADGEAAPEDDTVAGEELTAEEEEGTEAPDEGDIGTQEGDQAPVTGPGAELNVGRFIRGRIVVPNFLDDGGVPGSELVLGSDGFPQQTDTTGTVYEAEFSCLIPKRLTDAAVPQPSRMVLFGHDLLGDRNEVLSAGAIELAQRHRMVICGTDMIGMSSADSQFVIAAYADLSRFGTVPDRMHQGILNSLYLARAMSHPDGFVSQAAFAGTDGGTYVDESRVYYYGIGQGAVVGPVLTAQSRDLNRAALIGGGANFNLIVSRSRDFETLGEIADTTYDAGPTQELALALAQSLWAPVEMSGNIRPIEESNDRLLLQVVYGDQTIPVLSALTATRSLNLVTRQPLLAPDRQRQGENLLWQLEPVPAYPHRESAMVMFDAGGLIPPLGPSPAWAGEDPHNLLQSHLAAVDQVANFLSPDSRVINPCDTDPCTLDG